MTTKTIAVLRSNPKDAALLRLAKSLSHAFRVDCLIWDRQRDFQPEVTSDRIRYIQYGLQAGFYNLGTLCKKVFFQWWLFYKLMFSRYDVIHAVDLDTGLPGWLAAKLQRKTFVYHCLDPSYAILPEGWPGFLARLARKLENWLISQADLFIITDLLRMPQHEGATPKDLLEIANVPDIPEPLPPVSPPGSQFTVGYLGSLIEGRNLQTLVEACGALAGKGVHLVIGSFGPLESQIETLCQKYDNVTFKHWLPYEMMLLEEKAFDLFIHITDPASESQKWVSPNKLFEAMAFGKPILVGKHTLAAQRVEVFQNGIAVDYGSHAALTEAILHLKNNPNLAMDMGENGQREFQRAWRMDMMEKRLLEHYERLLNRL